MLTILALLAIAPPPPSQAYVEIRNSGTSQGYARVVNCTGGLSCSVDGGYLATFNVTLSDGGSGGNWDGGPAIPACSSGYVLDADGGVLYCINVIATATALAANPADCSANQYATTIAANGDLTCSQVSYSQLSGSPIAGGSNPQVQYNNAGVLGGLANVVGDGTHMIRYPETVPAAPGFPGSLEFDLSGLQSGSPMREDVFMGVPMPVGFYRTGGMSFVGSSANWYFCQNYCSQWNSTTMDVAIGCLTSTLAAEGSAASGGGWAATSIATRLRHVNFNTTTSQNWVGVHRGNLDDGEWVGNSSGLGGFVFHTRFAGNTHQTGDMTFAGVAATASAFTNGSRPAQQLNTAYVGCDSTDTNLQVCSNDGSTTSCTTTSASFPCRTNSTLYDVWLEMPPHGTLPDAGTGFVAYIERLDSAATIQVTKTSNLPTNNIQLTPHVVFGASDAGGTNTTKIDVYDLETWSNL